MRSCNCKQSTNYRSLNSSTRIRIAVEGIEKILTLSGFTLAKDFASDWENAVYVLQRTYDSFDGNYRGRQEFREAFKRHQREVSHLAAELISVSKLNEVANPIVEVSRSRIVFYDGMELDEFKIQPRSFWKAYRLFRYCEMCETANQLKTVLQCITTLMGMAKDFRVVMGEQDNDIRAQILEIQEPKVLSTNLNVNWENELIRTLDIITDELMQDRPKESYTRNFTLALKRTKRNFKRPVLSPENLKLSSASSGMTLKGYVGSIPGSIASMFEWDLDPNYDYQRFDELTGYQPCYTKTNTNADIRCVRNKCVAIEQPKYGLRLIHVLANQFQDRLTYYEIIHKQLARNLNEDATFKQAQAGVTSIRWMLNHLIKVINSLDLHAATNTMSRQWQGITLEYLFKWLDYLEPEISILMDVWNHIMSFDTKIRLPESKETIRFEFPSGQPMGFSDSFYSFATLHHIVAMTVARVTNVQQVGYLILGDDFQNAIVEDKDEKYARYYKDCMAFLNVECNLDKGYIFNADVAGKTLKIAEFAKFLVCEADDISPIPLGALSKSNSFGERLTLFGWLTQHNQMIKDSLTPDLVSKFCARNTDEFTALRLLSCIPVRNILNSKNSPLNMNYILNIEDRPLMMVGSLAMLKQSIILDTLIQVNRDKDYIPHYSDINSFRNKRLRILFRKTLIDPNERERLKNNKFFQWYDNLELEALAQSISVENILKGLLPDQDLIDIIPSLSKWSESDLNVLISLCSLWNSLQSTDERSSESTLTQEELSLYLIILEKIDHYDFDITNHRFGSGKDKIFQGFDASQYILDCKEFSNKLNFNWDEILEPFNKRMDDVCSTSYIEEPWETTMIDIDSELEVGKEHIEVSPWEQILGPNWDQF